MFRRFFTTLLLIAYSGAMFLPVAFTLASHEVWPELKVDSSLTLTSQYSPYYF